MRVAAFALAIGLLFGAAGAHAQPAPPDEAQPIREGIQIGLSIDRLSITSDFAGADLTIFGALANIDPLVSRQGRYDVIVVLEGPARAVLVRRKDRVLGMWINTESETFVNVPASYSVATTRQFQDITDPTTYQQMSLGADNIHLQALDAGNAPTIQEFRDALRNLKKTTGLYNERVGGVHFLSPTLFRATVSLAPNVPVGTHRARAFLFKNGAFVAQSTATLAIYKAGFEQRLFEAARDHGLLYGLFAVLLAAATGWVGSIVFRRE
jgi:uncharacterized protein (TIGR02186 family)